MDYQTHSKFYSPHQARILGRDNASQRWSPNGRRSWEGKQLSFLHWSTSGPPTCPSLPHTHSGLWLSQGLKCPRPLQWPTCCLVVMWLTTMQDIGPELIQRASASCVWLFLPLVMSPHLAHWNICCSSVQPWLKLGPSAPLIGQHIWLTSLSFSP
jgi:hypothetical protein